MGNIHARFPLEGAHRLQHGMAFPGADVEHLAQWPVLLLHPLQRTHMRPGQVHHMDEVAHAAAIDRGVIIPEHGELLADARRGLRDERDQVVGHADGQLADGGRGVRADRIEVAQQHGTQPRIGHGLVAQHAFAHHLGEAVGGIGAAGGGTLRGGQLGERAVNGATGGEHDGA